MDEQKIDTLFFVFNADGGFLNAVLDSARKLVAQSDCALCDITHGLAGEKKDWEACRVQSPVVITYVHRDEMTPELRTFLGDRLPHVVAQVGDEMVSLMGPSMLDGYKGQVQPFIDGLKRAAEDKGLTGF